jgi:Flp pilus assembly protein TadD
MTPTTEHRRTQLRIITGALAIVALIFIVYLPILPGNFVMDDAKLIGGGNALENGNLNLHTLWFGTDFTLATFGWWLEHLAFGNDPLGYHLVDLLLHAASCLLLWRVLAQLKIPGAWLAGVFFAVHPVCVNSVARIAELKNTLCLPFFLLSFSAYLQYEQAALYPAKDDPKPRPAPVLWLTLSIVAFVLALLAKTTAVMLPVVLLLCAAWQRQRLVKKDFLHTAPYFALSLSFGLMSVWFQKNQALAGTDLVLVPETFWQRLAAAGGDLWFYLGKALVPVNLNIVYSRPPIDPHDWMAYAPLVLFIMSLAVCWHFRRTWGRHVLFALCCFAVTLFPALGFFDAQYQTMWSVSDHLLYNSLPAIIALATAALAIFVKELILPVAAAILLAVCLILSFQRAQVFGSEENLVRDTLKKNPAAWAAHNDLGTILAGDNDYAGAVREFTLSLQYDPNNLEARMNLGHALSLLGKFDEADNQFQQALKMDPDNAAMHKAYGEALSLQGKMPGAIRQLQLATALQPDAQTCSELASWLYAGGDPRLAVKFLRQSLSLDPDNPGTLNNLAWILATSPDDSLRNGKEAVNDAEKACRLTANKRPEMLTALGAAYAEEGDFSNAMTTIQTAITVATAAGNSSLVTADAQFLQLYRAGKPYRE